MDAVVTAVAQGAIGLVVVGALVVWALSSPRARLELVVGGILAVVLVAVAVKGMSLLWSDPRPFVVDGQPPLFAHPDDNGFPSDHTAFTAAVAGVVLAARRLWGIGLLVLSALIGVARVLAHVHHVPDIVGGLLVGLVCAALAVCLARLVAGRVTARRELSPWGRPGRRRSEPTSVARP